MLCHSIEIGLVVIVGITITINWILPAINRHPQAILLERSIRTTGLGIILSACINLLVKWNRANLVYERWGNKFIAGGVVECASCKGYWPAWLRGGVWAPCFIWIMDEAYGARSWNQLRAPQPRARSPLLF